MNHRRVSSLAIYSFMPVLIFVLALISKKVENMNNMLLESIGGSSIMAVATIYSGILLKISPAKYGSRTGYNTVMSRMSLSMWDYAQKIFPHYTIQTGFILIILTIFYLAGEIILVHYFNMVISKTNILVNLFMSGGVLMSILVRMEVKLYKRLDEDK